MVECAELCRATGTDRSCHRLAVGRRKDVYGRSGCGLVESGLCLVVLCLRTAKQPIEDTQFQGNKVEQQLIKADSVASFIAHGPSSAVLVGIYKNHGQRMTTRKEREAMPGWQRLMEHPDRKEDDGREKVLHFDLRLTKAMQALRGRLVISWDNPIAWSRWAFDLNSEIVETLRQPRFRRLPAVRPVGPTERDITAKQRIGQSKFREALTLVWDHCCAVTGCSITEALVASHIKPWSKAKESERCDYNNGLLLVANLDRLFDEFLITFGNDGRAIISDTISLQDRDALGLSDGLKLRQRLSREAKSYMAWHREQFHRT